MKRTRAVTYTALVAGAALVFAACSTPGQSGDATNAATNSGAAAPDGSATGAAGGTEASGGTEAAGSETSGGSAAPAGKAGPCGIPHGAYDEPAAAPTGEVRVAWNDPLLSFNSSTGRGNAVANVNPLYLMNSSFRYYDGDLNLINNDQFGTCDLVSADPLTVKYTVNDGVKWSDGVQIGAADMLLYWAAQSGVFNDANIAVDGDTGESYQTDADGNPLYTDLSGAPVTLDADGNLPDGKPPVPNDGDPDNPKNVNYVPATGVAFDAANVSLALVTKTPEVGDDGRSLTAIWDKFYVDYTTAGIDVSVPAHVIAAKALGVADPKAGDDAIIKAIQDGDKGALKKIADFYNTGFDAEELPSDPSLYLSSGAYLLKTYEKRASMTFEPNPDYTWGPKPQVAKITYTIIGDPTASVQALQNEEVDLIAPQATADIFTSVTALADRGVEVIPGNGGTYEHVDLVFNNKGPFDPATYGGDKDKALKVRQAFLKTVPRTDILDKLIKPINPDAALRESFTTVTGAPTYDAIADSNGMKDYDKVDIEGAKALLKEAGVAGPVSVRLKFAQNNPRRSNEYDLMNANAAEAGFTLVDGRSASWGQELPDNSQYDASLFGWQSSAVDIAGTNANFKTGGQNNYGGYSNADVDAAYDKLESSNDADEQQKLLQEIEKQLVADAFGVTIFQFPEVVAYNSNRITNVKSIPLSPTIFWNFWEWQVPA